MIITVSELSKSYDGKTLFNIPHLQITEGFTCLFGPSGCGKTTLGRILSGLEKQDSGKITGIEGLPTVLFQEDRLLTGATALENTALIVNSKVAKDTAARYFRSIGFETADLIKHPHELSGGMARRVAIVRALIFAKYKGGNFVLLDEPFNGLDPDSKKSLSELLKSELSGKNVLVITHDEEDTELLGGNRLYFSAFL